MKKTFYEDPLFAKSKIIFSLFDSKFDATYSKEFISKVVFDGVSQDDIQYISEKADWLQLMKLAIYHSDAVICESENPHPELLQFCKDNNKKILPYQGAEDYEEAYSNFYDDVANS